MINLLIGCPQALAQEKEIEAREVKKSKQMGLYLYSITLMALMNSFICLHLHTFDLRNYTETDILTTDIFLSNTDDTMGWGGWR